MPASLRLSGAPIGVTRGKRVIAMEAGLSVYETLEALISYQFLMGFIGDIQI
jgi:hypothetical protein